MNPNRTYVIKRFAYTPAAIAIAIICLVGLVYWPVVYANFVWIDWTDFHDNGWLTQGDAWKHYIFKDFNTWTNYFRPLVVGLFTLEVRLFNVAPGPMHTVSLGIHLINTLLIGLLTWLWTDASTTELKRLGLFAGSMVLYGLHPVLIEPVAWIGCQFELAVTMLTLLGVLANISVQGTLTRAVTVGVLFFLASCAKESAASFPLIMVIFDWAQISNTAEKFKWATVRGMLKKNQLTYASMLTAGVIYLSFRRWALGGIVNPFGNTSSSFIGHFQEVCFIYLHYWKTLAWPMSGMGPIHPVDVVGFNIMSLASMLTDVGAISIVLTGIYLTLWRCNAFGYIITAITVSLLPVLHIASLDFDASPYHERYAMTGLAISCVLLARATLPIPTAVIHPKIASKVLAIACLLWMVFGIFNIRITIPLWSDNIHLWRWTLVENSDSAVAYNNLLSAYIDAQDYTDAEKLIERLRENRIRCTSCMLNAAALAVTRHDPARAEAALDYVRRSGELANDKQMFGSYLLTTGQMLILQGHLDDAEQLLKAATDLAPLNPRPLISLAILLALEGKQADARKAELAGLSLLVPNERIQGKEALDQEITSSLEASKSSHQNDARH